ncbi:MAG: hypothetical protein AUJ79_11625 [Propionibacterium sp. CG1_02_60_36]|nr:MAG: hypothetical protein AUJ79_11625 [Propionibacterium sp. CG1_02_60_36]
MDEQHWKAMLEAVEAAYAAASGRWTGATWTREYLDDGVWQPCPGGGHEADCYACAMVLEAAEAAEAIAATALEAARAGDWAQAIACAQQVAQREDEWEGHEPEDIPSIWGAFVSAIIAAAADAADDAEGTRLPRGGWR